MKEIAGLWWPDDVGQKWQHAVRHVRSIEWAIDHCRRRRTAVQAGGNVGLWPRRMAESFARVFTFEPEPVSRECLVRNVPTNVIVSGWALGDAPGVCEIDRKSLGSHKLTAGQAVPVTTVDTLDLQDVDLLQLDVEGYEWHALTGARQTLKRCRPLVQVELRGFTAHYGQTDAAVRTLLASLGYRKACEQPGSDVVWVPV